MINIVFENYSFARVVCEDSIFYEMREYFSFKADGYQFSPRFKCGGWSGDIFLLGYDHLLPYGLVTQAIKFAEQNDYKIVVDPLIMERQNISRSEFDAWVNSKDIYSGNNKITPHWYQADAVYEGICAKRKLLNLPTSAGKSLIQALLSLWYLENYKGKVLVIVPTTSLVNQMIDDFVDYRLFPREAMLGIKSGTVKDSNALIYVSTWQSAIKQKKEWFDQFGCVMNDECHLSTGTSIKKIIESVDHIPFKYGLSGSLRDGKANILQYVGMFGDIFRPVTTKQLMEEGQVCDLQVKAIQLGYSSEDRTSARKFSYDEEIKFITNHTKRNKVVCSMAKKIADKNENAFVMFRLKAHGMALYNTLRKIHDPGKVHFISGDTDTEIRDQMKIIAEGGTGHVFVASYGVFSTGVSIKNLHHIIFAHPVKSKVTVLQTIGRVLRKHSSKSIATVWDIIDDIGIINVHGKYTKKNYALTHAIERIERYVSEKFNYTLHKISL
ncbi:DNA helicase [Stenotrophomonas phage IME13]|uniref:DNA helicase n=1 Tax=Stenotrophomonas phage IME13 TaxID=1211280 RepID=J7HY36_9CAUD|nr:DNA helicase [Stenotrophomonas phage IME13]AFQ22662.1 DNA helicase [Stenotrophomonas phage IME13]